MSTTSMLSTGAIPPEDAPKELTSTDEALHLLSAAHASGMCLHAYSPNEWLLWVIRKLVAEFSVDGLEFLCCDAWQSADNFCWSLLGKSDTDRTIHGLVRLLERGKSDPEDFARALAAFHYDADDIRQAYARAEASLSPEGDDGEGPTFLFAYLKSLHSFCCFAQERGLIIVHSHWCA